MKAVIFILEILIFMSAITTTIILAFHNRKQKRLIGLLNKRQADDSRRFNFLMQNMRIRSACMPEKREDESEQRYLYRCRVKLTNSLLDDVIVDKEFGITYIYVYDPLTNHKDGKKPKIENKTN